jgi:hypothetical protein
MKKLVMICLISAVARAADRQEQKNYPPVPTDASDYLVSSMGTVHPLSTWMREQKRNVTRERDATDIKLKELNAKFLAQMEFLADTITGSIARLDGRLSGLDDRLSGLEKKVNVLEQLLLPDQHPS